MPTPDTSIRPLALATGFCLLFESNSGFRCAPCTYKAARIERQTYPAPPNKTTTHKWRGHHPKQAAVADLEALLITHRQGKYRPAHHQVVAGGALDVDAGGTQTGRIGILFALAANGSAVQAMGDDMLKLIAAESINQVKKSVTIDLSLREGARARI